MPVAEPAVLPLVLGLVEDALLPDEPEDETSVRMYPPRFEALELEVDEPAVEDPEVPVAVESAERRQPVTVIDCDELDRLALDPVWSDGVWLPVDCADAATASAAENTVPNIN